MILGVLISSDFKLAVFILFPRGPETRVSLLTGLLKILEVRNRILECPSQERFLDLLISYLTLREGGTAIVTSDKYVFWSLSFTFSLSTRFGNETGYGAMIVAIKPIPKGKSLPLVWGPLYPLSQVGLGDWSIRTPKTDCPVPSPPAPSRFGALIQIPQHKQI